nr:hypothetical protein [Clostridium botulinum]
MILLVFCRKAKSFEEILVVFRNMKSGFFELRGTFSSLKSCKSFELLITNAEKFP